jgi:hypothetical protein
MSNTTVVLDGDSSGLVGALQKVGSELDDTKAETQKLSDMLRGMADSADQAAGALVSRLGGGAAISAVAGVGAAFVGAQTAVQTFVDSSERMFQSYGDSGRQIWDKVEESVRKYEGALAEAAKGSDDLAGAGAKLATVSEGVGAAKAALLAPLGSLISQFQNMAIAVFGLGEREKELAAQFRLTNVAIAAQGTALENTFDLVQGSYQSSLQLLGRQKDLADVNDRLSRQRIAEGRQAIVNTTATRLFNDELAKGTNYSGKVTDQLQKAGVALDAFSDADTAAVQIMRSSNLTASEKERLIRNVKMAYESTADVLDNFDNHLDKLSITEREQYDTMSEALRTETKRPAAVRASTRAIVDQTAAMRENEAQLEAGRKRFTTSFGGIAADLQRGRKEFGSMLSHEAEFLNAHTDSVKLMIDKYGIDQGPEVLIAQVQAYEAAQATVANAKLATEGKKAAEKEQTRIHDEEVKVRKAADEAYYAQWVGANAKMVGVALGNGKTVAEAGRAALGNIISGLGDYAMTKAGISFAEGNFVGAAVLTALATGAYALGAKMGATAQKTTANTPATERQASVASNVTYSLRVDAAFADGESIARRFAQMQNQAQRRGLLEQPS